MKLVKVEMFLKIDETINDGDIDWIVPHISDVMEGTEEVLSFHYEDADPSDIGLDSL